LKTKANPAAALTDADRLKMALDIASGMEYLISNRFIHRDLAARNVLVDALHNCKVADFGLARGTAGARAGVTNADGDEDEEDYYRSRTGTFPVRWTAPESMQTMRFAEGSDIWSFGITLMEIYTDGEKPYGKMANAAVISQVQSGYRMPKPLCCTRSVYEMMLGMWDAKPGARPNFAYLTTFFQEKYDAVKPKAKVEIKKENANAASAAAGADYQDASQFVHGLGGNKAAKTQQQLEQSQPGFRGAAISNSTYGGGGGPAPPPYTGGGGVVEFASFGNATSWNSGVGEKEEVIGFGDEDHLEFNTSSDDE